MRAASATVTAASATVATRRHRATATQAGERQLHLQKLSPSDGDAAAARWHAPRQVPSDTPPPRQADRGARGLVPGKDPCPVSDRTTITFTTLEHSAGPC